MTLLRNLCLAIIFFAGIIYAQAQSTPADFRYLVCDTTQTDLYVPNIITCPDSLIGIIDSRELQNEMPVENVSSASSYILDSESVVGDIPYSLDVTPSGGAVMTVPIECVPSYSGFTPEVALVYNSNGGNSSLGYGWGITGASTISVCNKTYYHDGEVEGHGNIYYGPFILDGQRLILLKKDGLNEYYQTQQGNVKAVRYLSWTNPHPYFEVFYPDGKFAKYNICSNSTYYITELIDKANNKITYTYDNVTGHHRLKNISYDNDAEVYFGYGRREGFNIVNYSCGERIVLDYELLGISTRRGENYHRYYNFAYQWDDRELIKITCRHEEEYLNSLQLTYGQRNDRRDTDIITQLETYVDFTDGPSYRAVRGRFDVFSENEDIIILPNRIQYSNKKTDFIQNEYLDNDLLMTISNINDGIGGSPLSEEVGHGFVDIFCADIDNNPGDEIIKVNNYNLNGSDIVNLHVYNMFNQQRYTRTYNTGNVLNTPQRSSIVPKYYFTGDFNGDGRIEVMFISVYNVLGKGNKSCIRIVDLEQNMTLFNGDAPFDYHVKFPTNKLSGNDAFFESDRLYSIDYNGDGKTDLCHINDEKMSIYSCNSKGDGTYAFQLVGTETEISKAKIKKKELLVGEFNGDGKTDFILSPEINSLPYWDAFLSKGNGYFDMNSIRMFSREEHSQYIPFDVNFDGQTDIIERSVINPIISPRHYHVFYHVLKNLKYSHSPRVFQVSEKSIFSVASQINSSYMCSSFVSITPDGKARVASMYSNGNNGLVLSEINDSYGLRTSFKYQYQFGDYDDALWLDAVFPYHNYRGNFRVCSNVKKYNGSTLKNNINYKYSNAIVHRQGLGFCGFKKIVINDSIANKFKIQQFDPYNLNVPVSDESNVEKNTYTFNVDIAPNKLTKILLTGKTTENTVLNNTVTSSYTYDTYGNQLSETNNFEGNLKTTKNNQYTNVVNDNTNIIGLPTRISETSTRGGNSYTNVTEIAYNDAWFPASKKQYTNNNKLVKEEYFDYDSIHNLIQNRYKTFNSEWLNTTFAYDGRKLINQTNERGHIVSYAYNSKGNIDYITDHKGYRTTYSYDSWNRKNGATYPDGLVELTTRAWAEGVPGALIKVETIATGKPTEVAYLNALKQEIRTGVQRFDGSSRYVDKQYDIKGRLTQESQPFKTTPTQWSSYTYDDYDRILTTTTASGKTEIMTYSGRNTTSSTNGISTTRKYDAVGSLESIVDPGGEIIYNYRPDNQLSSIVAPGNIITSFGYDDYGRQTIINDPSAGIKQFAYDNAGNINCETDARGKTVRSTFDRFNLLTKRQYDGGLSVDYTYNDEGNLLKTVDSKNKSTSYVYDNLSRVIEEKDSISQHRWLRKNFHYGEGSVVTDIDYACQRLTNIATENYKYSNGHNTEITLNDTIAVWKLTAENSRGLTSEVRTGPLYRSYGYDLDGRSVSRLIYRPDADIQCINYKYNTTTGNVEWREDGMRGKRENFGYDNLNRLTTYGNHAVEYAPNGNITRLTNVGTFTYNNTVKPYAIETATSTAAKELIALRNQHIVYNAMQHPDTITEAPYVGVFEYYGDGRRAIMKIDKSARAGGYMLCRWYMGGCHEYESLLEIRKTTQQRRLYVGGDYYSAPAVYIKKGNEGWKLYYIIRDNLGSITHVTDTSGNLIQELSYDPWGSFRDPSTHIVYHTDEAPIPFLGRGFTGHEHLLQFGLINMNGRFYDPSLGRFLSPDPYVQMPDFTQNFNRYTYCLNNPLIYTDPNGEIIPALIIGGAALIGGAINVAANWDNIDGFWQGVVSFGIGAAAGGITAATGVAGASFWATVGVAAGGGFLSMGTNSIISQTGTNFSGMESVDWGQVGVSSIVGGVSGFAGAGTGYWAANSITLVNGISSPILRTLIVAPISSSAGHVASGTTAGLIQGQGFQDSFTDSFDGILSSIGISTVMGIGTTFGACQINQISPWTGRALESSPISLKQSQQVNGPYTYYEGTLDDVIRYVGITKQNPLDRIRQHQYSKTNKSNLQFKPKEFKLDHFNARKLEQININLHGLPQNGGTLYNKINSIAPKYWHLYNIK